MFGTVQRSQRVKYMKWKQKTTKNNNFILPLMFVHC